MFAIVASSGKQFRVTQGDRILVDRLRAGVGETVRLESVLLVQGDGETMVGRPFVAGACVEATVISHRAGDKLIVLKYKPKKHQRSKQGHRRVVTELKIATIRASGAEQAPQAQEPAGGERGGTSAPSARRRAAEPNTIEEVTDGT